MIDDDGSDQFRPDSYTEEGTEPTTAESNEVRLNRAILLKGISTVNCDKRDEVEVDKQFSKVTHLHLQNKGIDILESLHHFHNLTVLYLYDNRIREIVGLENARNLEVLYFQRNRLERISGLVGCRKLRKLYLGQNDICVVEGLHSLSRLVELHVDHQRLQAGEELIFDPTSLDTLSNSLQILNISGNGVISLENLAGMNKLETLEAQDNEIVDLDKTSLIIGTIKNLKVIDLRRNPITKSTKYQEKMIGHCQTLELLDGKSYSAISRQFIQKFCEMKAGHLKKSLATINLAAARTSEFSSKDLSVGNQIWPTTPKYSSSKSTLESTDDDDDQIRQLYPQLSNKQGQGYSRTKSSLPCDEEKLDQRLAQLSLIGQYKNPNIQAKVVEMVHLRRNGNTRLVKPQEITLPQFVLAQKSLSQLELEQHRFRNTLSSSSTDSSYEKPFRRSKVIKGLASRAIPKNFLSGHESIHNVSAVSRLSSSSSTGEMMPMSRSCSKNVTNMKEQEPSFQMDFKAQTYQRDSTQENGKGDNHGDIGGSVKENEHRMIKPQIVKLPPWPHIIRNVGTKEEVTFMS